MGANYNHRKRLGSILKRIEELKNKLEIEYESNRFIRDHYITKEHFLSREMQMFEVHKLYNEADTIAKRVLENEHMNQWYKYI